MVLQAVRRHRRHVEEGRIDEAAGGIITHLADRSKIVFMCLVWMMVFVPRIVCTAQWLCAQNRVHCFDDWASNPDISIF
ncbi:MAG: hypothetical protein ETSY2_07395 [Candidatus Entotheonella gemina]|uniref:Uncharacterized protein n=1 Tax=Candidatus Entotheonella gemina TaxID=1429439 RepID=W4MCL3_9BACT|nr:MAG: hypothetical protein ETSY2_07395 [Candidatus Entotheonella gemina]